MIDSRPHILAVTAGAPYDRLARSGSNYHLFTALDNRGILGGVVDARPKVIARIERLSGYSLNPEIRRQRSDSYTTLFSPLARRMMSLIGYRRARSVNRHPDVLLQVGAWYDFSAFSNLKPRLRVSYQDANLAVFLRRPDLALNQRSRSVKQAFNWERRVYNRLDLILSHSEWLRQSFLENFGVNPEDVVAVGSGANLDEIPQPVQREFYPPRFLFVGKDFIRKGGPQILKAFRQIRSRYPDAELVIAGPLVPPPSQPGVCFLGRISRNTPAGDAKILSLFRQATAFVMPSMFEAWGTVFLEAMAFGLPCIGSKACAMPEIIEDGVTGYLVSPHDVEGLQEALLSLASNPDRARLMGEAGRRHYIEHFTWDQVAMKIEKAITARL